MAPIRRLTCALGTLALVSALMLPQTIDAQGRAVRRAAAPRPGGIVVAAYYRPLFLPLLYDPFYDPWFFPYRYAPFGFGYGRVYGESTSLRLTVTPRDTEVFIDGYYAGTVDDFDGMFQRLRLEPGGHEVTLYLAGYRSSTQKIFLEPDRTFRIRHEMQRLGPGETADPRPVGTTPAARRSPPSSGVRGDAGFGAVAIRVQPDDADVFIDGERWEGPRDDEALVVQIAPGSHRIEVRKPGYRSYESEVVVSAAQTEPLNISLSRE